MQEAGARLSRLERGRPDLEAAQVGSRGQAHQGRAGPDLQGTLAEDSQAAEEEVAEPASSAASAAWELPRQVLARPPFRLRTPHPQERAA